MANLIIMAYEYGGLPCWPASGIFWWWGLWDGEDPDNEETLDPLGECLPELEPPLAVRNFCFNCAPEFEEELALLNKPTRLNLSVLLIEMDKLSMLPMLLMVSSPKSSNKIQQGRKIKTSKNTSYTYQHSLIK